MDISFIVFTLQDTLSKCFTKRQVLMLPKEIHHQILITANTKLYQNRGKTQCCESQFRPHCHESADVQKMAEKGEKEWKTGESAIPHLTHLNGSTELNPCMRQDIR